MSARSSSVCTVVFVSRLNANTLTEQEITGDVLLELDVNLLKSEIGVMAFGKRMRIANAITDLRRPPSVVYSDHPEPSTPISPAQQHSRSQSQSQSHHSYPGTGAASFVSSPGPNTAASLMSPTLANSEGQASPRARTFADRDSSDRSASVDDNAIGMALSPESFNRGFGVRARWLLNFPLTKLSLALPLS